MKGGIPFVLKRNADRSRFYRLVLHLQKSISGTAKTFKLLWLCPDSLFNRSRIHRLPFRFCRIIYRRAEEITGNKPMMTISEAEPIGPKNLFDALVILPCTGNTLAKLANGITDTPALMAAKAHLRNNKPLLLSLSTNDALGMNMKNIGLLLNTKNIYFVPFGQDDPEKKPNSMTAHTDLLIPALEAALENRQLQPVIRDIVKK